MKMSVSMVIVFLLAHMYAAHAADDALIGYNEYNGELITLHNIPKFASKMPRELKASVKPWLVKHAVLLLQLASTPCPINTEIYREKSAANLQALKDAGIASLSEVNYVIKAECNPPFVVKINSLGIKLFNLLYNVDIDLNKQKDADGVVRLSKCIIDYGKIDNYTTQTASGRIAHHLILQKIARKYGFEHINFSQPFLYRIPGRPKEICDENYVVVEPFIEGLVILKEMDPKQAKEKIINMPSKTVLELYYCATRAAVWDFQPKNCVFDAQGNILMADYETNYDHKRQFFFYQGAEGKENFVKTVSKGITHLYKTFQEDPIKQDQIVALSKQDQSLLQAYKQYECVPEFLATLFNSI